MYTHWFGLYPVQTVISIFVHFDLDAKFNKDYPLLMDNITVSKSLADKTAFTGNTSYKCAANSMRIFINLSKYEFTRHSWNVYISQVIEFAANIHTTFADREFLKKISMMVLHMI